MPSVPAVLSVDLEYFQHTPAYRSAAGTTDRPTVGREAVDDILDALDSADADATFFTVSEILDSTPDAVDAVADAGHEIGSHTHSHHHLSELSADRRREELATSRERLEAATGQSVDGFRAPSFDIADDHFGTLAATGYAYDSSIVPCRSIPGWYGGEYDLKRPAAATAVDPDAPPTLAELPVAVMPGLGLPLTGTWIRFFGVSYTILGMRLLARRGIPPVLYIHPWELADLPAVEGVPKRVYVRSGAYMRRALRAILEQDFEFVTARTVVADRTLYDGGPPP
ncbi:polysaccharide deacetylase family protein [Halapricum sp. CBA1109]|uniref:polysaccharide deacetylase family protein n=1 Tax=Halapricum sp. CBA1109 TaxID=2668068 RepID=UPI0012FC41F1|nr:polysaccharide deacetylase family protein [Halapricum sp. CBA1109]MUV88725.1 polysaccharide deacetylase family protein [Halapricum sp. CBA1109]